jgi:hypothetical protein
MARFFSYDFTTLLTSSTAEAEQSSVLVFQGASNPSMKNGPGFLADRGTTRREGVFQVRGSDLNGSRRVLIWETRPLQQSKAIL